MCQTPLNKGFLWLLHHLIKPRKITQVGNTVSKVEFLPYSGSEDEWQSWDFSPERLPQAILPSCPVRAETCVVPALLPGHGTEPAAGRLSTAL